MAVNVPNPGIYSQNIGAHITALRDAYQRVLNDNAYLTAMGGSTFLTAAQPNGEGYASGDAAAIVAALGNFAASAVNTPLTTALNNSQTMWGGQ